ncbi:unnamed protein product [Cuscuta epithymum]|uniref:Reverse transcriptase zinc-binding domain-containing protein n=1 Tax=Cuscuta epithymum TaxID=186058 RepID=A0AAV0DPZ6_9ASTE|nr:unnamed protein product [Cuscuta epithymum]
MIKKRVADFFWGSKNHVPKHHWIKFKDICKPIECGGVGIRSICDVQKLTALKLWWEFLQGSSMWADLMRSRYGRRAPGEVENTYSQAWRRISFISKEADNMVVRGSQSVVWKHTPDGKFTTQSAYKALWNQGGRTLSTNSIRNPKQVSKKLLNEVFVEIQDFFPFFP